MRYLEAVRLAKLAKAEAEAEGEAEAEAEGEAEAEAEAEAGGEGEAEQKMAPEHLNKAVKPPADKGTEGDPPGEPGPGPGPGPAWPLKMAPAAYLALHPEGQHADLARAIVAAEAEGAHGADG